MPKLCDLTDQEIDRLLEAGDGGWAAVHERQNRHGRRLLESMDRLTTIAEAQRILAVKLDAHTIKLIRLTWGLLLLTFGLLVFTVYLSYDAYLKGKRPETAKPHASQQEKLDRVYAAYVPQDLSHRAEQV